MLLTCLSKITGGKKQGKIIKTALVSLFPYALQLLTKNLLPFMDRRINWILTCFTGF